MIIPMVVARSPLVRIGEFSAEDLTRRAPSSSLEGRYLSVSACPHEWESIASLGGLPWFSLKLPSSALFVDVHKALSLDDVRQCVESWGLQQGLLERQVKFQCFTTDECGDESWFYVSTENEARAELDIEVDGVCENQDGDRYQKAELLVGTEALASLSGASWVGVADGAIDFVLAAYVSRQLHWGDVAGLFWDDALDPLALSAPRFGVFPERLDAFSCCPIENKNTFQEEGELWVERINRGVDCAALDAGVKAASQSRPRPR